MSYRLYYLQDRARAMARENGHVLKRFTLKRSAEPRQSHAVTPRPAHSQSTCRDCGAMVECVADVAPWSVRNSGVVRGSAVRGPCAPLTDEH